MKSNSGITTTSIIIYIVAMLIVVGIIATVTSFFYSNVTLINDNSQNISEITKFHMYFLEETNKENNMVNYLANTAISFSSGNTFTFQDKSIYLNHIKICENISNLQFSQEKINNKTVINVLIVIGESSEYTKTTQYVLNTNM